MYGYIGNLKAKEGKGLELSTILLDASKVLKQVKGSVQYIISKDATNEDIIWITEIWQTKEDHDNSLQEPEIRSLISKAIPLLSENPQKGQELHILGGLGL